MKTFVKILIAGFALFIFWLIYHVGKSDMTTNESTMLTILLAIFSILITWIITYNYSIIEHKSAVKEVKAESQKSLETYAVKAAEKVTSLSYELDRLSTYLEEESEQAYNNVEQELNSRKEKLASAIHIIGILKSNNDNALSDWRGVIPGVIEGIEDRRDEENEEILEEKKEEVKKLYTSFLELDKGNSANQMQNEINNKIKILKRKIDRMTRSANKIRVRVDLNKPQKKEVIRVCPFCKTELIYKQRPLIGSIKHFKCGKCGAKIVGRWNLDRGFCLNEQTDFLSKIQITEEMLSKAKKLLPQQPWPTRVHKNISKELNISGTTAHKIIKVLIERGDCFNQINGEIQQKDKNESNQ